MGKICLGTAQLGLEYGVANRQGKPDRQKAFGILDSAWAHGIRDLDTAALYGDSESLLGEWIRSRGAEASAIVVTKLPLLPELEGADLTAWIHRAGQERLRILGVRQLEAVLLHRGGDLTRQGVLEGLQLLKASGLCRGIGLSAYHPEEAERGLDWGLDAFQVPYNILDRRFEASGWLKRAKERGVRVYGRSPFLQGLLLLAADQLPENLDFARPVIDRWRAFLESEDCGPLEAALRFSLTQPDIGHTVLGVDSEEQLDQIMAAASVELPRLWLSEVLDRIGPVEERLLLPYLWNA